MKAYTIISDVDEDGVPFVPCACSECETVYEQQVYPFELSRYNFDEIRQVYVHRYGQALCGDCLIKRGEVCYDAETGLPVS